MSTTISANAHAREPVTLCYKRRYDLQPQRVDAALLPTSPASYPCHPLYRNSRRLPFVQSQWFYETLHDATRRLPTPLEWSSTTSGELRADWQWTLSRLTRKLCKADGVPLTSRKPKHPPEEAKEEEKTDALSEQPPPTLVIQVSHIDALDSSPEPAGEEADEKEAALPVTALSLPLSLSSASSAFSSARGSARGSRRGSVNELAGLTAEQLAALGRGEKAGAETIGAKMRLTVGGRTRVVRLRGEEVRLAALREEWRWGVKEAGRVGVVAVLELHGYLLWVKEEDAGGSNAWAKQLREPDGDEADKGDKRKK